MRSFVRMLAVAGASVSLAPAVASSTALAADTTPPKLTIKAPFGVGVIQNKRLDYQQQNISVNEWTIVTPGYSSLSNEDGTITFTDRDGVTGRVNGRVTFPFTLGYPNYGHPIVEYSPAPQGNIGSVFLYPSQVLASCNGLTAYCGERHRLPIWSLQHIDVQAADAAGNRSPVQTFYAVVLPDTTVKVPIYY